MKSHGIEDRFSSAGVSLWILHCSNTPFLRSSLTESKRTISTESCDVHTLGKMCLLKHSLGLQFFFLFFLLFPHVFNGYTDLLYTLINCLFCVYVIGAFIDLLLWGSLIHLYFWKLVQSKFGIPKTTDNHGCADSGQTSLTATFDHCLWSKFQKLTLNFGMLLGFGRNYLTDC